MSRYVFLRDCLWLQTAGEGAASGSAAFVALGVLATISFLAVTAFSTVLMLRMQRERRRNDVAAAAAKEADGSTLAVELSSELPSGNHSLSRQLSTL